MAAVAAAARLTEAHRLAQSRLGAETARVMLTLWRLLDPNSLDATTPEWLRALEPLIARQFGRAVDLAGAYYRAFRTLEVGAADAPSIVTPMLEWPQVATSLTVTGPVAVKASLSRGAMLADALDRAAASSAAAAMRSTINGGRSVIVDTAAADPKAIGFQRVTSGKACAFCLMLASRGPVYKSKDSATTGKVWVDTDALGNSVGEFRAHDSCSCHGEPIFRYDSEWAPEARKASETWQEATRGLSGTDALNAFRRALNAEAAA